MNDFWIIAKSAARNPERAYCMLLLAFRYGLRVSELCSLKVSDVNPELRELHVRRVKGSDSGRCVDPSRACPPLDGWVSGH
jgi:integrase